MNILNKLNDISIETYFHPIISIKDQSIVALEALSRYKNLNSDKLKPINILMEQITDQNDLLHLDLELIKRACNNFINGSNKNSSILLFINLTSSIVNKGEEGVLLINEITDSAGIDHHKIVLEILEENLNDTIVCNSFFKCSREYNYHIALDDVGVGFSNLQRIAQVKPDIIKLDRSLVSNIDGDFYKRKVFNSLTRLAHDIGSLVVAEGVEQEGETLTALKLGAGLLQGFYFCKPDPSIKNIFSICSEKIQHCREELKSRIVKDKQNIKTQIDNHLMVINKLSDLLSKSDFSDFENRLTLYLDSNKNIDCLFILDKNGCQITESITIYNNYTNKHFLFHPAPKGADHSLKPFYIEPDSLTDIEITGRYVSQASGKYCRTYSKQFFNNKKLYILCVDYTDGTNDKP